LAIKEVFMNIWFLIALGCSILCALFGWLPDKFRGFLFGRVCEVLHWSFFGFFWVCIII